MRFVESARVIPQWQSRSPHRMDDPLWDATLSRVRGEFDEMPCLRVTPQQACILFGLSDTASAWVLSCLARDGFLEQTENGEYARRNAAP